MTPVSRIGSLTVIAVRGEDRRKILNNLCTQDLRNIAPGTVAETFITDVKGRTLSHGLVLALSEELWFVSEPGQAERLVPHLDRYIIREDATVLDRSSEFECILFGTIENARRSLHALGNDDSHVEAIALDSVTSVSFAGHRCYLAPVPWIIGGGVAMFLPHSWVEGRKNSSVLKEDLDTALERRPDEDRSQWELERIRGFWPRYGIDLDDRNLPQEISIDQRAISFKKGCYLGQETVARLDALGQVQKRLVLLHGRGALAHPLPWTLENEGKEIGTITSATSDTAGDLWGLGILKRSHFQIGSIVNAHGITMHVVGPKDPT